MPGSETVRLSDGAALTLTTGFTPYMIENIGQIYIEPSFPGAFGPDLATLPADPTITNVVRIQVQVLESPTGYGYVDVGFNAQTTSPQLIAQTFQAGQVTNFAFDRHGYYVDPSTLGGSSSVSVTAAPSPQPATQSQPDPTKVNDPCHNRCNPLMFQLWWSTLPLAGGVYTGQAWYDYEQRVTRSVGLMPGDRPRTVPAGGTEVDADGANPGNCRLLDAKYVAPGQKSQFRVNPPPWIVPPTSQTGKKRGLPDEFHRYWLAINTPNIVFPGATPSGLEVRTNSADVIPFLEQLLIGEGFTIGINGFVVWKP